ncbi:MAG: hypothetical protein H7X80_07315, partial [bacterium]|nr:hypothetical protein [Candidatus Kapabacteria bacterium]
ARVAANTNGAIAVASTSSVYYSADNAATWSEKLITGYMGGTSGTIAVPAFIARSNGDFLLSLTTYDQAGNGYYAGKLYRIGSNGVPTSIGGVATTFKSLVEDRNAKLYGVEETLDQISGTFRVATYQSADATTWTAMPSGTIVGASYNTSNRYVRVSSNTELRMGTTGGSENAARTLRGFSSTNNMIARLMFAPDNRLYMTSMTGGLFATAAALQ